MQFLSRTPSFCFAMAVLALIIACAATPSETGDSSSNSGGSDSPTGAGGTGITAQGGTPVTGGMQGGTAGGGQPVAGKGGQPGTGGMAQGGMAQAGAPGMGGMIITGPLPGITAPMGSPVADWGRLSVCGTKICSQRGGPPVQLKGVSSMWLHWENTGYAKNAEALKWMRDNWKLKVIRASMGIEPPGAYLSDQSKAKGDVEAVIRAAVSVGIYVIVDWHDHNAQNHQQQATAFFTEMAGKYGAEPNVLWETFNEPLQVDWTTVLKPYHTAVVAAIRAKDPDNLIIMGTPQWSQRVDQAASNPVVGTNLLYAFHFYSCSHGASIRTYGEAAISRGAPLFVTEWGATHADGGLDGKVCIAEAQTWLDWLNTVGVGWVAWKLDDCEPDATCLLRPGAPVGGGWTDNWLRGHATFVRERLLKN